MFKPVPFQAQRAHYAQQIDHFPLLFVAKKAPVGEFVGQKAPRAQIFGALILDELENYFDFETSEGRKPRGFVVPYCEVERLEVAVPQEPQGALRNFLDILS